MLNATTLNNLIAVVIVILVLSLIVQSMQSLIKKLLKSKSKQIEESLVDLFEHVLDQKAAMLTGPMQRLCAWIRGRAALDPAAPVGAGGLNPVNALFEKVLKEFYDLGRSTVTGGRSLDSISKDDLKKVMSKSLATTVSPPFQANITAACTAATGLSAALNAVLTASLGGEANAKFEGARGLLSPLLEDLRLVAAKQNFPATVVINDVLNLRKADVDGALKLLAEVQAKAEADRLGPAASRVAPAPGAALPALSAAEESLQSVIAQLASFRTAFDAALAPIRLKLDQVEAWFDTVMQGFSERYSRGMKTCSFWISLAVVIALNANLFAIYKSVANDPAMQARIIDSSPKVQKLAQASTQPTGQDEKKLQEMIEGAKTEVGNLTGTYAGFGFEPFNYDNRDLTTPFGWLFMAILLSLGAPFWEDVLESLFGVKTLLRKKADIKPVEEESGTGYPKS